MAVPGLSIPTPQQPILSDISGGIVAQVWWRFFQGLLNRTAMTITYVVATVAAVGTTQGSAFVLSAEWNNVNVVPINSGVVLPLLGSGLDSRVWNTAGNSLNVYPPVGCQIDELGVNAPYVLAASKSQVFSQLSGTEFRSLQLG